MRPGAAPASVVGVNRWKPLVVLSTAMFLMVLDTSVMNVSISQLVEDFDTEVTAVQAAITLYTLVMASFMVTGGKLGDIWGRRRAFTIGLVVYGIGSGLTSIAPTLGVLVLGWSVIEGLGAALVMPALAALVGGNYQGADRAVAYGVIGGMSGIGIAVGPLLGGWVTTYLTWRLVFAGEVVIVLVILALTHWIAEPVRTGAPPRLDGVGIVLSALGLALIVLGVLQSSSWGWIEPRNAPFTVLGFSPTVFVIAAGFVLLAMFRGWERLRERHGTDPLIRFALFRLAPLRAGLTMLLTQNLILLGAFFAIPLYLQVVQGFTAFETGLRLLPTSVAMLLAASCGPLLTRVAGPRRIVQGGLVVMLAALLWLVGGMQPQIDDVQFACAMAVLGLGMGLLASQLGNVVQSSVDESARSEVGGLQFTAQNLGSSLGTALIGSILIGSLAFSTSRLVSQDSRVSANVDQQVTTALEAGISFVSTDQVQASLQKAGVPPQEADAVVENYAQAQLEGLRVALMAAAGVALAGLWFTRELPRSAATDTPGAGSAAAPFPLEPVARSR